MGVLSSNDQNVSEVLYRSIDLFVVSRLWAVKYLAVESNSIRTTLMLSMEWMVAENSCDFTYRLKQPTLESDSTIASVVLARRH